MRLPQLRHRNQYAIASWSLRQTLVFGVFCTKSKTAARLDHESYLRHVEAAVLHERFRQNVLVHLVAEVPAEYPEVICGKEIADSESQEGWLRLCSFA